MPLHSPISTTLPALSFRGVTSVVFSSMANTLPQVLKALRLAEQARPPHEPARYLTDEPARYPPDEPARYPPDEPARYPPDEPARYPPDEPARYLPDEPARCLPDEPARCLPDEPARYLPDEPARYPPDEPTGYRLALHPSLPLCPDRTCQRRSPRPHSSRRVSLTLSAALWRGRFSGDCRGRLRSRSVPDDQTTPPRSVT